MRKSNKTTMIAILILIAAVLFMIYDSGVGREAVTGVTTASQRILFINEPVDFDFDLIHDNITLSSNNTVCTPATTINMSLIEVKMDNILINTTVITEIVKDCRYNIKYPAPTEGYLTITVENKVLTMQLKAPVVLIEYNIPIQVYKGDKQTLFVMTKTPQGEVLNADKVILEIVDPHSTTPDIIEMKKDSAGVFSHDLTYAYDGNYYFTIRPSAASLNYKTIPKDAVTIVMKDQPAPIFYYFMLINIAVFILVLVIKNRKKIFGGR